MFKNIDVYSLSKIKNEIKIIDIRSIEKYNTSHIESSINIPYEYILNNPSKYLNKSETYCFYCQYGRTSTKLSSILYNQGYKVLNLIGGYEAWLLK